MSGWTRWNSKCTGKGEAGGTEPARDRREDTMLPALIIEEGATGQGGPTSVEAVRGEAADFPSDPSQTSPDHEENRCVSVCSSGSKKKFGS